MWKLTRRNLLVGAAVLALPSMACSDDLPSVHVVKGTGCECCGTWVDHLKAEGFAVTEEERYGTLLIRFKMDLGIPASAYSCHTGTVAGYALEGHVPAADIRRLLTERPDAIGLVVPDMPYGSPGMGNEAEREAFEVLLIRRDGGSEVFSRYGAASG